MKIQPGTLYVVATPIGNIDDLSPRAREVLANVSLVAAEDTRHAGQLLTRFGISARLVSLHEHVYVGPAADKGCLAALVAGGAYLPHAGHGTRLGLRPALTRRSQVAMMAAVSAPNVTSGIDPS